MLNAKDFNRKKFDDNWLGIVLPKSSQDRQMEGFGGYAIRRKVAIIGHTPSNRGEIDDKDVVFAIVALPLTGGTGAAGTKQTPRISQGDVVYGTFLDKDTKQQPIILGALGRTGKVKYEKGVYGRYDITSGFVGSLQPLKLFGRGQTNEDNRDCSPISIPFEDAMRLGGEMLSEKGGVPTEPTVGAIPPPPKSGETEVDPDIDEKITNAENEVQRLEDTQAAFDAQEAASEGSTDREAYEENEEKLNDARSEVNSLKETKNKTVTTSKITDLSGQTGVPGLGGYVPGGGEGGSTYGDSKYDPYESITSRRSNTDTGEGKITIIGQDGKSYQPGTKGFQDELKKAKEAANKPIDDEPDFKTNREAWNEWNVKESQLLKDDPDSSGFDMF